MLPDFTDRKAAEAFVEMLRLSQQRHGVRRLLQYCEKILKGQKVQQSYLRRAQIALQVANGQRTLLQLKKDHERGWRNTAEHFYASLSDTALFEFGKGVLAFAPDMLTRDQLIKVLVENYVGMRTHGYDYKDEVIAHANDV